MWVDQGRATGWENGLLLNPCAAVLSSASQLQDGCHTSRYGIHIPGRRMMQRLCCFLLESSSFTRRPLRPSPAAFGLTSCWPEWDTYLAIAAREPAKASFLDGHPAAPNKFRLLSRKKRSVGLDLTTSSDVHAAMSRKHSVSCLTREQARVEGHSTLTLKA